MDRLWPSRNWIEIGVSSYQLSDLYEYQAPNFYAYKDPFLIQGNGGLILRYRRTNSGTIEIFSNDGSKIYSKSCLQIPEIKTAFWLNNGNIGFLHFDCSITICTYTLEILDKISSPEDAHVFCDYAFPNGIAFLTDTQNFYYFDSVQKYNIKIASLLQQKSSGDIVQIAFSSLNSKTGFAASTKGDIFAITSEEIIQLHSLQFCPNFLVASPDGESIAAIQIDKINVRSIERTSIGFVDSKTIAIGLKDGILIYQSGGKHIRNDIIPLWIGQDFNGIRIYTENYAYLLNPVSEKLLKLNKNPLANYIDKLAESYEKFKSKDIDSYKILKSLKPALNKLLTSLCEAVPYITERAHASRIIEIAAFGKADAIDFDPETITKTSKICQLLFTLRSKEQGFAVTAYDLEHIEPIDLVSNVAVAHKFALAGSLANYFHVNKSIIGQVWAQNMLEIHKINGISEIVKRISQFDKIDYLRLAQQISLLGLDKSHAITFLQLIRDPYSRSQALKQFYGHTSPKEVLADIIASRDGDTILRYLFNLRHEATSMYQHDLARNSKRSQNSQSTQNSEDFKIASNHFQQILKDNLILADHYALFTMHIKWERLQQIQTYPPSRIALIAILNGGPPEMFGRDIKLIYEAIKFENDQNWKDLLTKQQSFNSFIGRIEQNQKGPPPSPREAICILLRSGTGQDNSQAERLVKQYQISDKMFIWMKIQTYSKYKMIQELENTILTRKAPIVSANQIFTICLNNQLNETALKFMQKHGSQITQKSLFKEAALLAREQKNESLAHQFDEKSKE